MRIIDSHLHTIDLTQLTYPWLDGFEPLRRDFPVASYEAEARRCGITDALHMEVDVRDTDIERETDYVVGLCDQPGSLVRGAISACRPEDAGFPAFLERARSDSVIRGFRRVLHTQPDQLSQLSLFRSNLNLLAGTGLPFDICMTAMQLPLAAELADACPRVQFVLDHCGIPPVADGVSQSWRMGMVELARRPNVMAKISGVVAYAKPDWSVETLRPFVEHTIVSFGWDRVVWGSDWPVCTLNGSLASWAAATHALTAGCSAGEKHKLLAANAARLWRLA